MHFKNKKLRSSIQVAALALLATFPTVGHAVDLTVDLTPDTTRYLSDPSFLPLQGQIYSETIYTHTDRSNDLLFTGEPFKEHFSTSTDEGEQMFRYGVTDRLTLNASGSYSSIDQHTSASFASMSLGSNSSHNSDFNNPSFGATYRVIEQTDSPVSFDVTGSYSPSAVDQSSQSGSVNLFLNRETRFVTIQGEIGATYIDQYGGRNTPFITDHNGYWNYFAGVRSQIRLTDQFSINSGVLYSKDTDITYDDGAFRDSQDGTWTPFVTLSYGIVPGKVDVAFEYDHAFIGGDQRSDSFGLFGKFSNDSRNLYAAHLRLLF